MSSREIDIMSLVCDELDDGFRVEVTARVDVYSPDGELINRTMRVLACDEEGDRSLVEAALRDTIAEAVDAMSSRV